MEKLRDRVLDELRKRGLSPFRFANKLGKKASTVEKWLYKVEDNPKLDTIQVVLKALGMDLIR